MKTMSSNNSADKTTWNIWACYRLMLLCFIFMNLYASYSLGRKTDDNKENTKTEYNQQREKSHKLKYTESETRGVFQALSGKELKAVSDYLINDTPFNLSPVTIDNATLLKSTIYLIEQFFPDKAEALAYLDNGNQEPARWAKAVLFRGDVIPPVVEEYKVGPLPTPTSHELIASVDYLYRPCSLYDPPVMEDTIKEISQNISDLLLESYGATFHNCGQNCLFAVPLAMSPLFHNSNGRVYFYNIIRFFGDDAFQTINLEIILELNTINGEAKTKLLEIWYGPQIFKTTEELMDNYRNNKPGFKKFVLPKPTPEEPNVFSLKLRNKQNEYLPSNLQKPTEYLRPPVTHEPDGKRYEVHDHVVTYLDWQFSYQLRPSKGPALFDVRFQGERIAYEISLQELAVIYSANTATFRYGNFFDGCFLLGGRVNNLVPGFDCPEHASFLPAVVFTANSNEPIHFARAFCLFEINHPVPLHRHRDFSFYGGLANYALTLRTIITVGNYDYLLEHNFFQTGGLEVKVHSTGYAQKAHFDEMEKGYGWEFPNNILPPIHQHLFNYKVDIDIHGTSNRFEKLKIGTRTVPNTGSPIFKENISLMYFERKLAETEEDGKYNYDFQKPTYLIFHNNEKKQQPDMPKSYRLHAGGIAPLLTPKGENAEESFSFARHQVVVTQRKETEPESSSIYAQADGTNPHINFYNFVDNETIVDQDLVAWVNLGIHHIPHTEDFPITPTLGTELAFHLTPYNYFPLCPSYQSLDGVYFKQNFGQPDLSPVSLQNVLLNFKNACPSNTLTFLRKLKLNPNLFF